MRIFPWIVLTASLLTAAEPRKTRNIILITADGLRWQEIFTGIDPALMNEKDAGMKDAQALRERLWRSSPDERRKLLLPFFWGELAPKGVVLGNVKKGSSAQVTNGFRVSYPGYSEILTGRAQDEVIRGNDKIQNPSPSVLEFLQGKLNLDRGQVALFGSWEVFHFIGEHTPGSIFINAGYRAYEAERSTPRLLDLSRLQFQTLTPWESVRHDYITFEMALEYLKTVKPRVLHIAFGETDDWAHEKRYDRVLEAIGYFDRSLRELFAAIESMPEYRGTTSVLLTSDHGRGSTLKDWDDHGRKVPGAEQIWMVITGPDTPAAGEAAGVPEVFQRDVTPTILDLLGINAGEMKGVEGKPIPTAVSSPQRR